MGITSDMKNINSIHLYVEEIHVCTFEVPTQTQSILDQCEIEIANKSLS